MVTDSNGVEALVAQRPSFLQVMGILNKLPQFVPPRTKLPLHRQMRSRLEGVDEIRFGYRLRFDGESLELSTYLMLYLLMKTDNGIVDSAIRYLSERNEYQERSPDLTLPLYVSLVIEGGMDLGRYFNIPDKPDSCQQPDAIGNLINSIPFFPTSVRYVGCDPRLVTLLQRSFPEMRFYPFRLGGALDELFFQGFPVRLTTPYLVPERRKRYGEIGIAWKSSRGVEGKTRSLPLMEMLRPFADLDVTFVNCQYGDTEAEIDQTRRELGVKIVTPDEDPLLDLDGHASVLAGCDAVLMADQSSAHFAGALGVPGVVVLPANASWRWRSGDSVPWYPSLKLIRQTVRGEWGDVLERARGELPV